MILRVVISVLIGLCLGACTGKTELLKPKPQPKNTIPVQSKPLSWVIDRGLCDPETITLHPQTGDLIISNICEFKANGAGYLSLASPTGDLHTPKWVDGLNAPAGSAIYQGQLYVVDLDRVHVIDLTSGEIVDVLGPYKGARAFNDIAIDASGTIYVTDSANHHVRRITDRESSLFPDDTAVFKFANGLHVAGDTLLVGGEKLWRVDRSTGEVSTIMHDGLVDIDGIEGDGGQGFIISIVGGDVWHLPETGSPVIWTANGLSSTNHAYLPKRDLVIVPTGFDNTILAFKAGLNP